MEVLFSLDLFESVGGVDEGMEYAMDFDLWGRMLLEGGEVYYTGIEVGMFRKHEAQKTSEGRSTTEELMRSAIRLTKRHPSWPVQKKDELINRLTQYQREEWHKTGRLARAGLPKSLVLFLRDLRTRFFNGP